jgi:HSP20 family protein
MTLTRRQTERYPITMRNPIDRLLNDWQLIPADGGLEPAPAMDVRETNDAYIVEVDLPGLDPNDVEVLIEGRTLTIKGQYSNEAERQEAGFLLHERRRGRFLRAVALPDMVEVDKVTSKYENGQLIISLPKASQNKARKVAISSSGTSKSAETSKAGGTSGKAG